MIQSEAKVFHWPLRVYYEDTDSGGVVYHANYLRFLERARTEWLRNRGVMQSQAVSEHGIVFAVVNMQIDFRAPAKLDDELVATCVVNKLRAASILFDQQIIRSSDSKILLQASVRAACLQANTFTPCAVPEPIFRSLQV